jgi:Dolichyl-phosphate-mannose-protein mannosyltransferase
MPPSPLDRRALAALGALSVALLAVRLYAAGHVGFGDSEALYASYALHPQPAYLDHPGLVGVVARLVGSGSSPSPFAAHLVTSVLATAFPWAVAVACWAAGATWRRSLLAALVVAVAPEIAVGLFALTPDLLLAFAWTATLACAAIGLRSPAEGGRAALAFAAAGLLAGVSAASKVTGLALFAVLPMAYVAPGARRHARTLAPWVGLVAGALVVAPIVAFESHTGWPMLRHRLVDGQPDPGFALRNVGALVGGQLAYLSPLVAVLAVLAARAAWRERGDAVGRLLLASFLVPLAVLVPLCLWSRVAEPHWIAPALLGLVPAAARAPAAPARRLVAATVALGAAIVLGAHAWVLVPGAARLAPASYDARLDLSNELRGWPEVVDAVREIARMPGAEPGDVVVAGPHWVICAQLEAALRDELRVGCDTPVPDDFDTWWPRTRWRSAEYVLWVSDARFGPPALPTHVPLGSRDVRIVRDGRTVRVFTITLMAHRAQA